MNLIGFQSMDISEYEPLLLIGFSTASVDQEPLLTFGTLVSCTNVCLKMLTRVCIFQFCIVFLDIALVFMLQSKVMGPLQDCLAVSLSGSHTVGRGFASRPGHIKDYHKNGTFS